MTDIYWILADMPDHGLVAPASRPESCAAREAGRQISLVMYILFKVEWSLARLWRDDRQPAVILANTLDLRARRHHPYPQRPVPVDDRPPVRASAHRPGATAPRPAAIAYNTSLDRRVTGPGLPSPMPDRQFAITGAIPNMPCNS